MTTESVDPRRSRIVLVGVDEYQDETLADLPQVVANLRDLNAVFTDPRIGGFPAEHCVTLPSRATLGEIGRKLTQAAREADDLLLFYFCGHGVVGRTEELYFPLHDTYAETVSFGGLPFETVRGAFLESRAANCVVIVDSCYSGRVIGETLSGGADRLAGQLQIRGTYTLASAPPNKPALVSDGEVHTAFTGRLLSLLREGIPGSGPLLTMEKIYWELYTRLSQDGLPLPQQRGTQTIGRLGLVRNRQAPVSMPSADGSAPPAGPSAAQTRRFVAEATSQPGSAATDLETGRPLSPRKRAAAVIREAEGIAAAIDDDESRVLALIRIAVELIDGDPKRAAALADEAERVARRIPDEEAKASALRSVSLYLGKTDPERCLRLADLTKVDAQQAYIWVNAAEGIAAIDPGRAELLFAQAQFHARMIDDPSTQSSVISVIVRAMDPAHGEALARTIPDLFTRAFALTRIATGLVPSDPDEALKIARSVNGITYRLTACAEVAAKVAETDPARGTALFDGTERLARFLPRRQERLRALTNIARVWAPVDVERALRIAGGVKDFVYREGALTGIAEKVASTDPDRALRIAADVSAHMRARVQALVSVQLIATDPERAGSLLREAYQGDATFIPMSANPFWQTEILTAMMPTLAVTDPDRALRMVTDVHDAVHKVIILSRLANALLERA